jgi:hypothetical protein
MKAIARTLISLIVLAFLSAGATAAETAAAPSNAPGGSSSTPQVAEVDRQCTEKCKSELGQAEAYEGCMIECKKSWSKKNGPGGGAAGTAAKPAIAVGH